MEILTMKNKPYIVALSLLVLLSAGCDWRGIRGNGTMKTEQRPVTAFTRIQAGGFYEIQWQPGPPSLSLTTDENLLSHIGPFELVGSAATESEGTQWLQEHPEYRADLADSDEADRDQQRSEQPDSCETLVN